jgi:hypothetical protein
MSLTRNPRVAPLLALLLPVLALLPSAIHAQTAQDVSNVGKSPSQVLGIYVFGRDKQTKAQQDKDDKACFAAAKEQSGYDDKVAAPADAAPAAQKGGLLRGAAKGAVAGVAIGAVAGDAGKGAAIGATGGALGGRVAQKSANKGATTAAANADAQKKDAALSDLKRAYSACMDARGYSTK